MKKIILAAALLIAGSVASYAQTSATTNLKVELKPILTIEVMQNEVLIEVISAADYQNASGVNGVTKSVPAHLKVVANSAFEVKASTTTALVNTAKGSEISQDNILISITDKAPVNGGSSTATAELNGWNIVNNHNLGQASATPVITVNSGTVGTLFNVDYKLSNVTNIASLPTGTYATVVTYSIVAK